MLFIGILWGFRGCATDRIIEINKDMHAIFIVSVNRLFTRIIMQKFKELKYVQRVLVFLLVFCIVFAGSSTDAIAKSKKAPAVKSISLKIGKKKVTKKTYQMKQGEKKKIKVSVSPKKGKNVIQFATSNKKVATVSKKGTVTAKKAGTARIKVTVKKGASKKKGRVSKKKTTWVKIKVVKASNPNDKPDSNTEPPSDQNTVKGKKSLVVYFPAQIRQRKSQNMYKKIQEQTFTGLKRKCHIRQRI